MSSSRPAGLGAEVKKLDFGGREHVSAQAQTAMDAAALAFARAARRSLPFLARFKGKILPRPAEGAARDQPVDGLSDLPLYTTSLAGAAGAWATVTLSAQAIAMILEGSMGGRGAPSPTPLAPQLTVAQKALVARIARSLARDFAGAVREVAKLEMSIVPDDARKEPVTGRAATGLRVVCDVEGFGGGGAAIIVTVSAEPWDDAVRESTARVTETVDPRIGDALPEVPLTLVAELGRISLGLRRVLSLKAGDVIRLPTAVDDAIALRIEGNEKFRGMPITSRGQLAVEIRSRHGK